MSIRNRIGRNEPCPCGGGLKFKKCHGRLPSTSQAERMVKQFIDSGEEPIRWVVTNDKATAFFVDKQGRILVFADRDIAVAIAQLDLFASQVENEINIAGIGPTKWQKLQETLPFIEVESLELALAMVKERIEAQAAEQGVTVNFDSSSTPE